MGVIHLQRPGLLLDSRWEIVPNDPTRWSLDSAAGEVRLKHGLEPIYLFLPTLSEEKQFVLDVKNTYNPLTSPDVGGLVVYSDPTDHIKLEEYFDVSKGTSQSYPWLRLVRDYNSYSAYWSEDGIHWHFIGTQEFDRTMPRIGLFLEGESGEDLLVEHVRVYRATEAVIGGLVEGIRVDLTDENGNVVDSRVCPAGQSEIHFPLTDKPIPYSGHFRLVMNEASDPLLSPLLPAIWGGDTYVFGQNADLYYVDEDGAERRLAENIEEFLGYINNGSQLYREIKMIAKNDNAKALQINIGLTPSHGTDHYARLVHLAPDANGAPGAYSSGVTLPTIASGNQGVFWLKVSRETDPALYHLTTEVYFGLNVSSNIS
jgi:hypothetical protein